MNLLLDFQFAKDSEEFSTDSDLLQYVAAINPEATIRQFLEAGKTFGYKENTIRNRFRESRKFSVAEENYILLKDGSLQEP